MDTNKMREQFEAWYFGLFPLEEAMLKAGSASSARNLEQYFRCWQASREAVVVELPNRASEAYQEYFEDVEGGCFNEATYIRDVCKAVEVQGLRVKP